MRTLLAAGVVIGLLLPAAAGGERARSVDPTARIVAQALAEAIAARDAEAAAALCALPVSLDGEQVTSAVELERGWRAALERDEVRRLRLIGLELLTREDAIERWGPPPPRLGSIDEDVLVAWLRWDRAQLLVVLAERDGRWAVIAVTD